MTITNTSACDVVTRGAAMDMSSGTGTCTADYATAAILIPAGSPAIVWTVSDLIPTPPGAWDWFHFKGTDPNNCPPFSALMCNQAVGEPTCFPFTTSDCITIASSCNNPGCPSGTNVNLTWSNSGGNITVNIF